MSSYHFLAHKLIKLIVRVRNHNLWKHICGDRNNDSENEGVEAGPD